MIKSLRLIFFFSVLIVASCTNKKSNNQINVEEMTKCNSNELYLLVGTYTLGEDSDGLFLYKLNIDTKSADSLLAVKADNPSYFTLSRNEDFIYAVGESGDKSTISAFSFDKSNNSISHINTVSAEGADPCYIEIDDSGHNLFTANYSSGSISVFSVGEQGRLSSANFVVNFEGSGPDKTRQSSSHLHSVRLSPDGVYLFATDLGADKIYRFPYLNSVFEGQPAILQTDIREFNVPVESGPRHFDFHPSGKYMYLLGEISGQIVVFDYNEGDLIEKQIILSDTLGARGAGDIHVSPNGRFLYSSNRLKGDGIAVFSIDENTGELTKIGYQDTGKHPRNFVISPDGSLLLVACRDENKIQVYNIDGNTGLLTDTGNDILVNRPVCLKFASVINNN